MMALLRRLFGDEYPDRYETFAEYAERNSPSVLLERAALVLLSTCTVIGVVLLLAEVLERAAQ